MVATSTLASVGAARDGDMVAAIARPAVTVQLVLQHDSSRVRQSARSANFVAVLSECEVEASPDRIDHQPVPRWQLTALERPIRYPAGGYPPLSTWRCAGPCFLRGPPLG